MRIAALLYGRIAQSAKYYDNIKHSIGKENDIDFFLSSDNSSKEQLDEFIHVYKPVKYINDKIVYSCNLARYGGRRIETNIHRMTCHFINKSRVFSLLDAHIEAEGIEYNVVITLRCDVIFHDMFVFDNIVDNTVYIPDGGDHIDRAINDQVAYGTVSVMRKYCRIFENSIKLLEEKTSIPHPESLTYAHLHDQRLTIIRPRLSYTLNKPIIRGTSEPQLPANYTVMENNCQYVCSRGLLKSCKKFQSMICSSNRVIRENVLIGLQDGDSLYICTSAIPHFAHQFLPHLTKRIVLVSGDADETIPYVDVTACVAILSSPYILKWYAQNCLTNHSKVVHLPIGMDYHTMSSSDSGWGKRQTPVDQDNDIDILHKSSLPFHERLNKCYTTFHFALDRGDRREAFTDIPKDLVYYEPTPVTRAQSHAAQVKYAFVVSPYGGGPDCHRTWEALALGCIPIIKSCKMDPLFEGLPVLLVQRWSDVTQDLLDKTIEEFKGKTFNYEKLTLRYWVKQIEDAGHP